MPVLQSLFANLELDDEIYAFFYRVVACGDPTTACISRIFKLAAVASSSAGKAEPNLTEVIFTSAPKPKAVGRLGCPHLCVEPWLTE